MIYYINTYTYIHAGQSVGLYSRFFFFKYRCPRLITPKLSKYRKKIARHESYICAQFCKYTPVASTSINKKNTDKRKKRPLIYTVSIMPRRGSSHEEERVAGGEKKHSAGQQAEKKSREGSVDRRGVAFHFHFCSSGSADECKSDAKRGTGGKGE